MVIPVQIGDVVRPSNKAKHNRYCGPAALSILTGIDTQQASLVIRSITQRHAVTGTPATTMWAALKRFGFRVEEVRVPMIRTLDQNGTPKYRHPTLNQWMSDTREHRGNDPFLVGVTGHWVVVQGSRRCCSLTGEVIVQDEHLSKGKMKMTSAYRLTLISAVDPNTVIPLVPDRAPINKARRAAVKLAAQYGIELDWIDNSKSEPPRLVYPPVGLFENDEDDPHEGDHTVSDWHDVLQIVQEYAAVIDAKATAEKKAAALDQVRWELGNGYLKA